MLKEFHGHFRCKATTYSDDSIVFHVAWLPTGKSDEDYKHKAHNGEKEGYYRDNLHIGGV
jgi:hypothetical protein